MNGDSSQHTNDTQRAIMEATYRALRDHGYSGLSISKIAAEFEKSKSLLYYHYDDKDELLVAFLEHLHEQFSAEFEVDPSTDPNAQLEAFFDLLLPPAPDEERLAFQTALFELRALAPHDDTYRRQFEATDRYIRDTIAALIEAGVEQGVFRDVDVESTAQLLLTVVNGGMLQQATTDDSAGVVVLRDALDEYVSTRLRVADA